MQSLFCGRRLLPVLVFSLLFPATMQAHAQRNPEKRDAAISLTIAGLITTAVGAILLGGGTALFQNARTCPNGCGGQGLFGFPLLLFGGSHFLVGIPIVAVGGARWSALPKEPKPPLDLALGGSGTVLGTAWLSLRF